MNNINNLKFIQHGVLPDSHFIISHFFSFCNLCKKKRKTEQSHLTNNPATTSAQARPTEPPVVRKVTFDPQQHEGWRGNEATTLKAAKERDSFSQEEGGRQIKSKQLFTTPGHFVTPQHTWRPGFFLAVDAGPRSSARARVNGEEEKSGRL